MGDLKFKTVQDYYLYISQGHTFAPRFEDLILMVKLKLINEFNEYNRKADDNDN